MLVSQLHHGRFAKVALVTPFEWILTKIDKNKSIKIIWNDILW